jgi:pimeloyl-ACP methyl ester carboxylesterase
MIALLIATVLAAPASAQTDDFYTPPATLPREHGALIRERAASPHARLSAAKSTRVVLYRSTSPTGAPVAVSGTVSAPKGRAPRGGWPVISWAHGSTGIADACAPSRFNVLGGYDSPLLNRWLRAGFAVVRTDYEGLGTPGDHPYLVGVSEGRSVLDIVRAARRLDRSLGRRLIVAGHSQGGHAALWAAALAPRWTPELSLRGTVAFAPASHIGEQAALLRALTQPGGVSGLAALIVRGIDVANPSLNMAGLLSDRAAALYPQIGERCLGALAQPDSFGGLAPADFFRPDASVDPVVAALNRNDPETLRIRGPVRIEQGLADGTVLPNFTHSLANEIRADVAYRTYRGVDHVEVATTPRPTDDATRFIARRL